MADVGNNPEKPVVESGPSVEKLQIELEAVRKTKLENLEKAKELL